MKKLLPILLLSACLGPDQVIGPVKLHCDKDCPPRLAEFFDEEEQTWEEECDIDDFYAALENIHGRLHIYFFDGLEEETGALGRYWPREHFIEIQYPHTKWQSVLRHEVGLAIGQTQLGYVGERAKVEWYQCHPKL